MPFNQELDKKFKLVNWKGGDVQIFGKFGTIDINKLTAKQAENLIKRGFTKLAKKKKVVVADVATDKK